MQEGLKIIGYIFDIAAGGSGVGYTNIGTQYWQTHLLGYGRIAH